MVRGLYSATAGMLVETRRLDVISNNLANASTSGFKRDQAVVESFPELPVNRVERGRSVRIGTLSTGSRCVQTVTDFTPGSLKQTGNPLDLALTGDGFFAVAGDRETYFTRSGSFRLDASGYLVTASGHRVLGERGPIRVAGGSVRVRETGEVEVDGQQVDRLLVVELGPRSRQKVGDNLYRFVEGSEPPQRVAVPGVVQGCLEMSNVNVVREMVDMIQVTRAYEANQKVIQAQDETLGKAVNEVGRV